MSEFTYKCGHTSSAIVAREDTCCIAMWMIWKDSVGHDGTRELCFSCWLKKQERK